MSTSNPAGAQTMSKMNPEQLDRTLHRMILHDVQVSLMLWGMPGLGKSSIVQACAERNGIGFIDVRLSQLAPTDIRGLPVPEDGISKWFPPEFLPRDPESRGILFLDEFTMAPPMMQGVAQQLILDRKVGSYVLPPNWVVWAAGNRKEDRASVYDMPAPLANRFMHIEVEPDLDAFLNYARQNQLNEAIAGFLKFKPEHLHAMLKQGKDAKNLPVAFPTPRTWEMASELLRAGIPVETVIGVPVATEFNAYCAVFSQMPDLDEIISGSKKSFDIPFPGKNAEPSLKFAICTGLFYRAKNIKEQCNALRWVVYQAGAQNAPEWGNKLVYEILNHVVRNDDENKSAFTEFKKFVKDDPVLHEWRKEHSALMKESRDAN